MFPAKGAGGPPIWPTAGLPNPLTGGVCGKGWMPGAPPWNPGWLYLRGVWIWVWEVAGGGVLPAAGGGA